MNSSFTPIVCCGFAPCVQRILEYSSVEKGAVNRALKVTVGIGGKGANTARMVRQLGGDAVLVGFIGGANGTLLEQMLDAEEVGYRHVIVEGETRICQTLVEEGNPVTTELVEEMPPLTSDNWQHMMKLIDSLDFADAIVAISGKLPAGAPVDAYARISSRVAEQGGRVILDAPGEPLLAALEYKPFLVKINDEELLHTVGEADLLEAGRELIKRGAQSILITRGSRSAFYLDSRPLRQAQDRLTLELFPPEIQAVNPVGSGDAVTAGMAVELARGSDIEEAIRTGMACGAANALNLLSGMLKTEDVEKMKGAVRIVDQSAK